MIQEVVEISCLACGRNLGKLERSDAGAHLVAAPESPSAAALVRKEGTGLACGRCGGRALFGPAERQVSYAA